MDVASNVVGAQIRSRKQFGAVLTEIRIAAGLTISQVADESNVPRGTLGGWFRGGTVPQIDAAPMLARVLKACGAADRFDEIWTAANQVRGEARPARPANSPYRGLKPYGVDDAELFFGRDDLITDLVDRVAIATKGQGSRLIGVLGPSGAGKSSLLHAGLMVSLTKAGQPVQSMTPGRDPQAHLDAAVAAFGDRREGAVLIVDQAEELWTYEASRPPLAERPTYSAESFARQLVGLIEEGAVVVVALRPDFFAKAIEVPMLRRAFTQDPVLVVPMSREQLEAAIVEPAKARDNTVVAPGLVAMLLQELSVAGGPAHDPGALPLLSHALHETWIRRTTASNLLTVENYRATGGIREAIGRTAHEVWKTLDPQQQTAAQRLFTRAVHQGETGLSRIVVRPEELDWSDIDRTATDVAIEEFVKARLLTTTNEGVQITHEALLHAWDDLGKWIEDDKAGHALHLQLARFTRDWVPADSSTLVSAGRTEELARWRQTDGRAKLLTLHEARFLDACEAHHAELAGVETRRLEQEQQRSARLQELVSRLAVQRGQLRKVVIALALVGVVLIGATVFAVRASRLEATQFRISHAHEQALASYPVRSSAPEVGGLLAVQAFRSEPDVQTRSALLNAQSDRFVGRIQAASPSNPLYGVGWSPDGKLIATSSFDKTVRLWDAQTHTQLAQWETGASGGSAIAFSRDGTRVANAENGVLRIWSTRGGFGKISELPGIEGGMSNIAFSFDGRILATFAQNLTDPTDSRLPTDIRFFDADTLASLPAPRGDISDTAGPLAFSETGVFAVAGTGPIQVWPTIDAAPITLERSWSDRKAVTLAVSRDGRTLVAGDQSGLVSWWSLADGGKHIRTLQFDTTAWGLDFSKDGSVLAIGLDDHSVRLFDVATGEQPFATLVGHSNSIHRIAFSDDGNTLLTSSSDGSVGIWDTADLGLRAHSPVNAIAAVAQSRDGSTIAAATADGTVHLWGGSMRYQRLSDPRWRGASAVAFADHDRSLVVGGRSGLSVLDRSSSSVSVLSTVEVVGIAVSDTTTTVAVAYTKDTLHLWDPRGWTRLPDVPVPAGEVLLNVSFGGSSMLAANTYTNHLLIWDLSTGQPRLSENIPVKVTAVAFSPDMRLLAYSTVSGEVKVHAVLAGAALSHDPIQNLVLLTPDAVDQRAAGIRYTARQLVFSPDSSMLAAAGEDAITRIWNTGSDGDFTPHAMMRGHYGPIQAAAFVGDSNHLVTAGQDGILRTWNLDTTAAAARICSAVASSDPATWLQRNTVLLDERHC